MNSSQNLSSLLLRELILFSVDGGDSVTSLFEVFGDVRGGEIGAALQADLAPSPGRSRIFFRKLYADCCGWVGASVVLTVAGFRQEGWSCRRRS